MDHYLAIIQTILDRCENDNTSPDIHDMEIIKINLCRIIQTRRGLTQLWFIPLIERIQNACCRHYDDVDMLWENFVKKNDWIGGINMSTKTSKEYKAIKNYIHNELGLTKEDIINAIRSDIRKYVEECICNTYGNDNNIERMIKFMVDNELKNKDFNVIPRMVEKVLKDKMLNDIEIVVINKNLND